MIRATFAFLLLIAGLSISLTAQGPIVIDENDRVVLHGNVHPSARPQFDIGRTDPSLRMGRMIVVLRTSTYQQRNCRRQQEVPVGIGSSDHQLQAVTGWLRSQGLLIDPAGRPNGSIRFSGTVSQVEQALRVEIHNYVFDGHSLGNTPSGSNGKFCSWKIPDRGFERNGLVS